MCILFENKVQGNWKPNCRKDDFFERMGQGYEAVGTGLQTVRGHTGARRRGEDEGAKKKGMLE